MTVFAQIWHMLTPRQRRGLLAMQLVSLLIALSAAIGIAAIAPFFAVLGEPALIEHNASLHWLHTAGGFSGDRSFMVALVLIAHRMNTVRACDVILELDRGRLIGSGTYDGLLKSSQGFRQLAGVR